MRDVRIAHAQVEEDVVPAPVAHAVEERFENDVHTGRGKPRVARPRASLARVVVDLPDVLRHGDAVVVRRDQRRRREDPLQPLALFGVEGIGLGRHPVDLIRESELPVIGARLEVLERSIRCPAL
jgi:hypothetical protein